MRTSAAESWFLRGKEGAITWSGEGKWTPLGSWGETLEGGTQKASLPDDRITGSQDNRITRTARITESIPGIAMITEQGLAFIPHSLVAPKGPADL